MRRDIDLEAERVFENKKVDDEELRAAQSKYYWAVRLETDGHDERSCEVMRGRNVLEIGCSHGKKAEQYLRFASSYVGVDISDSGISKAKSRNLPKSEFMTCDAHELPFENGTFQVVVVNSLLHHLDLDTVLKEIDRVLGNGGFLCAREPLGTNPIFNLYRNLTPNVRTVDERPFTLSDLKKMEKHFEPVEIKFFGFFSVLSAFIYRDEFRLMFTRFDRLAAKTWLRYLFWQFSGIYKKLPEGK